MEYQQPYPSSVPHVTLQPASFQLNTIFYGSSIIIQCFFLFICSVMLAMAIYFRLGNYKLLIDQSNNKQPDQQKQNIINQVLDRTNYLSKLNIQTESQQSSEQCQQAGNSLQRQLLAGQLRIYERRIVYVTSFTIGWLICVNLFKCDIVIVIMASIMVAFVILFNIKRMLPDWKVTILVYFIPAIAAFGPYMTNQTTLYPWVPVKDPLALLNK